MKKNIKFDAKKEYERIKPTIYKVLEEKQGKPIEQIKRENCLHLSWKEYLQLKEGD